MHVIRRSYVISSRVGSIFLISVLILGFSINPIIFQKSDKNYVSISSHLNSQIGSLFGKAFAESNNASNNSSSEHSTESDQTKNEQQSEGNNTQINEENNHTYSEHQGENENQTLAENKENYTEANAQGENETEHHGENEQQSAEEIENEKNNENATHHETEQDASDIELAKTNETIAAEVDIGPGNVNEKSIDNNVSVKTENTTSDAVNITVSASSQTGPKVILINLNSTTIDVANVKYLHIMYDGHTIAPASSVEEILHASSSDQPHYAILITQSGAQLLISIPHFSTHTITISSISKVITPIPEFPLSVIAVFASIIAITVAISRKRITLRY